MKTIAEKEAEKAARVARYRDEVVEILRREGRPLGHAYIEFYVRELRVRADEDIEWIDDFEIRYAISTLVREGALQYAVEGIRLLEALR
jgi:hypothetical protein